MVQVDESGTKVCLKRRNANCKNFVDRFYGESDTYTRQFAGLYMARTEEFRTVLQEKACAKWGSKYLFYSDIFCTKYK